MNNKITTVIVIVFIFSACSFYGGMMYGKSIVPVRGRTTGSGQFSGNTNSTRIAGTRGGTDNTTFGEIISKKDGSITIKMQDGSTKIVLVATSTQIIKSSTGTQSDLSVGTNVVISGTTNSDGSITAQNTQIRPAGVAPFGVTRK